MATVSVVTGEGTDCVGVFVVEGRYDTANKECHWTKTYVGGHDVFYGGTREEKGIWGTWEIDTLHGGFKIWPLADGGDEADEKQQEPVEAGQRMEAVGGR